MAALVVPDDQALLEALADGDLGALRLLYDRHAPWLSVRLGRRCNDREVVADCRVMKRHGGRCIDVLCAFNSSAGTELIADLLVRTGLAPVRR